MNFFRMIFGLTVAAFFVGCVPKQKLDDTQAKLRETQDKLKTVEQQAGDCDANTFLQLKEQVQNLDMLSQELVDRNTELSKEVARLRSVETTAQTKDQENIKKIEALEKEVEARADRVRRTYEDLVRELRGQIKKLEEAAQVKEAPKPSPKPKSKKH